MKFTLQHKLLDSFNLYNSQLAILKQAGSKKKANELLWYWMNHKPYISDYNLIKLLEELKSMDWTPKVKTREGTMSIPSKQRYAMIESHIDAEVMFRSSFKHIEGDYIDEDSELRSKL